MSREQKENLNEAQMSQRNDILKVLYTNMSLCSFKKGKDEILNAEGKMSMLADSIK